MSRILMAGALLFIASCQVTTVQGPAPGDQTDADTVAVDLPDTLTLRFGETVVVNDFEFSFNQVLEDNRCPTDVECIWAGNAAVELAVGPGPGRMGPTYQLILNTTIEPRAGEAHGMRITLLDLAPQPVSTRPTPPDEYIVTLSLERFPRR